MTTRKQQASRTAGDSPAAAAALPAVNGTLPASDPVAVVARPAHFKSKRERTTKTKRRRLVRDIEERSEYVLAVAQPWERQPEESPEAYRSFSIYRDMDPCQRSAAEVQRLTNINRTTIDDIRAANRWVERCAAWDFHLERARLQSTENYQVEMAARHADLAKRMLEKVAARLLTVNLDTLGAKDIAAWLDVGIKNERLSRGLQSDAGVAQFNQFNTQINGMTDEELLAAIAREGRLSGGNGQPNTPKLLEAVKEMERSASGDDDK